MTDYGVETNRLNFLIERDGIDGAVEFAKRTLVSYRRAVVNRDITRDKRQGFIESYLAFKRFLHDQNQRS